MEGEKNTVVVPKLKPILLLTVIVVSLGTNFCIFNSSVTANLGPTVIDYINRTQSAQWLSSDPETVWAVVVSIFSAGTALGSLCAFLFAEALGRKLSLILCGVLNVIGGIMCAFYLRVFELVMVGRIFQGLSLGIGLPLASAFVTEITPVRFRGKFNAILQLAFGFGDFCGMLLSTDVLLGSEQTSNYCLAITLIPSLLQILVLIISYDTPRHLILKRRKLTKGKKALEHYQGKVAALEAMNEILAEKGVPRNESDDELNKPNTKKWKNAVKPIVYSSLLLITLGFSGISQIMAFATIAFTSMGLPSNVQLCTVTLGLCNLISALITISLMERWGRKRLLTVGLFGCFFSVVGFTIIANIIYDTTVTIYVGYLSVVFLDFFLLFYSMAGAAANTLAAEICSQKYRSFAVSLANFFLMAVSTMLIELYFPLANGLGDAWVFLPAACISIVIGCYLIYVLPETAGKSLSEIKRYFRKEK